MNRRSRSAAAGFTLVELLVVVAIVGILASIAITQYALYKAKAVDAQMQSALNSAREAMECHYVKGSPPSYSGATEAVLRADCDYRGTAPNVRLLIVSATLDQYVLLACAAGASSPAWRYDSNVGTMVPDSGGSC
jgi:prepilin-type N-terminal cleavage/methylation domain-containing protein